MIKPIIKDVFFLRQKSVEAKEDDISVAIDLLDTLAAHREGCVGLAANMIGVSKRIIVVDTGSADLVMINPQVVHHSGPYETEESCLSLTGKRPTRRFEHIEVEYFDQKFKYKKEKYSGWVAQIIQHELDHLEGIII